MSSTELSDPRDALALIRRGVAALGSHDMDQYMDAAPPDAAAEELADLRRLVDALEIETCRRLARFVARRSRDVDPARSATDWLVDRCGMLVSEATRRVDVARNLHRLAATVDAHRAGIIGFGQVQTIASALDATDGGTASWTVEDVARRCEPAPRERSAARGDAAPGRHSEAREHSEPRDRPLRSKDQLVEVGDLVGDPVPLCQLRG